MKTPQVQPRLRRGRRDDAEINSCHGFVWERRAWAKVDVGLLRDDVLSRHDAARCRCAGASVRPDAVVWERRSSGPGVRRRT